MANAQEGRRSANNLVQTDQYGHFAFHALPPGEYAFFAGEEEQSADMKTIQVCVNEVRHSTVWVRLAGSAKVLLADGNRYKAVEKCKSNPPTS